MLALSRYCHATGGRELNISILSLLSCASFATPFFWRGLDLFAGGGAAIVLLERVERNGDAGGFPLIPQYSPGVKLGGGRRCRCGGREEGDGDTNLCLEEETTSLVLIFFFLLLGSRDTLRFFLGLISFVVV